MIVSTDTPSNGTFTLENSQFVPFTGTVTQDARLQESGIPNEYVVDWVDGNGLTVELINSNLQVLETYNIADANGTSNVAPLGNGELFVTYRVKSSPTSAVEDFVILNTAPSSPSPPPPPSSPTADMIARDGSNGNFEIYNIGGNAILAAAPLGQVGLEWLVAGFGGFSSNAGEFDDMLLRNSNTGQLEVYDISNNTITDAAGMGQVGLEWQVAGFGGFSSNTGETDMLMRNSNTGGFEVYDIRNNTITSAATMGQVGLEWSVAGFGDFSTNAGETDMLMRNSNSGMFEVYDISKNAVTSAAAMGQVGLEWQVAGFGNFSGKANETDMLMRNSNTGTFEVYDISNNTVTNAAPMGQVGLEWQVAGFGDFSSNAGETDMLMRNGNTGALEVYDISNNTITSAASMGQIGLEWQVAGVASDPPGSPSPAATVALTQAMASFSPAGSALSNNSPAGQPLAAASQITPGLFAPSPTHMN